MLVNFEFEDQIITVEDQTHGNLEEIRQFAKGHPEEMSFYNSIDHLCRIVANTDVYKKLLLYPDWAKYSLGFTMMDNNDRPAFSGGLIYHGPVDGVFEETFSVSLNDSNGWQIHT